MMVLEQAGFMLIAAADAEDAQKVLDDKLPDLILLDWMLPGQSGVALARKWRVDPRIKPVPILMIIAIIFEQTRKFSLETAEATGREASLAPDKNPG